MYVKALIRLGNAAFDDGDGGAREVARILRQIAGRLEEGHPLPERTIDGHWPLRDVNGNSVGEFSAGPVRRRGGVCSTTGVRR